MLKILLIVFCSVSVQAFSGMASELDINLAVDAEYYEDVSTQMTLTDILSLPSETFLKNSVDSINIGTSTSALWFKIDMSGYISSSVSHGVFWFPSAYLSHVEVYLLDADKNLIHQRTWGLSGGVLTNNDLESFAPNFLIGNWPQTNQLVGRVIHTTGTAIKPMLSTESAFKAATSSRSHLYWFYLGVVSVLLLYNSCIAIMTRRSDYWCYVAYSLCTLVANINLESMIYPFIKNSDTAHLVRTLFWIFVSLNVVSCLQFQKHFCDIKILSPRLTRIIDAFSLLALLPILMVFFSRPLAGALIMSLVGLWAVFALCAGVFTVVKGSKDAPLFLIGFGVFIIFVFAEVLRSTGILDALPISTLLIGSLIEIVIFAISLAIRVKRIQSEALHLEQESRMQLQEFNETLESKVIERTKEVKNLLHSVPQGIFVLTPGILVRSDYSDYLGKIFSLDKVEEDFFLTRIIDSWQATEEKREQLKNLLNHLLGGEHLDFVINQPNLPIEMIISYLEQDIVIGLTWSPVVAKDKVAGILVTLADNTQKRRLQRDNLIQKNHLQIVSEIVRGSTNSAIDFFVHGRKLVTNIERAYQNASKQDLQFWVHSFKGESRTLGFDLLSNELHVLEELIGRVDVIRSLRKDLDKMVLVFEQYGDIVEKIGFSKDGSYLNDSSQLVLTKLACSLNEFHKGNLSEELVLKTFDYDLVKNQWTSIQYFIQQLSEKFSNVAKSEGLASGRIDYQGPFGLIQSELSFQLKSIFIHMIRNSIAHGYPNTIAKSKGAILNLNLTVSSDGIVWKVWDNGVGLNIRKIRDAILREHPEFSGLSSSELMTKLMEYGGSSKPVGNQLSGRGLAISGIARLIRSLRGEFQILLHPSHESEEYIPFEIKIDLPSSGFFTVANAAGNKRLIS